MTTPHQQQLWWFVKLKPGCPSFLSDLHQIYSVEWLTLNANFGISSHYRIRVLIVCELARKTVQILFLADFIRDTSKKSV